METLQSASQISILVIMLVGMVKPFIPSTKKQFLPFIAVIIGIIIAMVAKQDPLAVMDGIMAGLIGTVAYKAGSTETKGESSVEKKSDDIIQMLNSYKK